MKRLLLFISIIFASSTLIHSQCPPGSDIDSDGDGVEDCIDPCVNVPNSVVGNLSFESDFLGWDIPLNQANFNITQQSENVLHGSKALLVSAPNAGGTPQLNDYNIISETFTAEPNDLYTLKFAAKKTSAEEGDYIGWVFEAENGSQFSFNNIFTLSTDWTTYEVNFSNDPNISTTDQFKIVLRFGTSSVDIAVDRLEVYKTEQGFDPAYQDNDNDGQPDCGSIDVSNHPDYQSLVDIYNSTNGANWSNNTNWLNTGTPLNTWNGISTVNINGEERVTQINLEYNNLNGNIPSSIGDLTYLGLLNLQVNQLNGAIPDEIGNLSNLTFLRLNTNNLSGAIPTSIGNLSSLNYLILSVNNFTGGIPTEISNLSSLFWLMLGSNPLGGTIPSELGNLSNLGILDLRANDLTGSIPPELGNLTNLYQLFLFFNDLSGTLPAELGNLTNLNNISLYGNDLEGNIPMGFANFTNLQYLDLADNNFGGAIPDFSALPLDLLWIQDNKFEFGDFETEFPSYQSSISDFQYAPQQTPAQGVNTRVVENGGETTLFSEPISGTNNLYQWYFNSQPITGATIANLTLTDFDISQAGIYECLVTNSIVTGLSISTGVFEVGIAPSSHPDYNALIDFYNGTNGANWTNNANWLDETQPISSWFGITETSGRVTGISLNSNNLVGNIPESIGDLTELETFSIRLNSVSGSLPETIINLTKIQYFDINSNNMVGIIAPWINVYTDLWYYDIGFNFITGSLPEEITTLNNLQYIYLQNNQLEGEIPPAMTNMQNLAVFFASDNNLLGTIPDFSTISTFFFCNVQNNQFTFADIEPNYAALNASLGVNYQFAPQQFIDINRGVSAGIGETVTLNILSGLGTNLTVDWYDGTTFGFLGSGTSFDVIINTEDDYGEFLYYVTSATIPGLGLQSRNITVGPSPTTHPDFNALLAVFNALDGPNWDRPWDVTAPIETWDANALFGSEIVFDETSNRVIQLNLNGQDKVGQLPPELGNLSELTSLNIGSGTITGSIPSQIGNLSNLTYLFLFGNDLSGEVPTEIWNLTNLTDLFLGAQQSGQLTLTSGIPASISNLQNLEWLNLNGIPLSQPLQPELFNLPSLIRLRLQDCGLTGQLPAGFANISDIFADRNDFTGTIPTEILNVTNNNRLSITNNLFDFSDLEPLAMSNGYNFLTYSPQRTQDVEESVESGVGADITLNVNDTNINRNEVITAMNNQYQWFKDSVAISGANGTSYTITNAQEDDSGVYFCRITNPLLPDLVIDRAPISLLIDSALNLSDNEQNGVSVYPNPAENWITIKSNSALENAIISLYDLNGRLIFENRINGNTNTVNVESLRSGIYILNLQYNGQQKSLKFVKQ